MGIWTSAGQFEKNTTDICKRTLPIIKLQTNVRIFVNDSLIVCVLSKSERIHKNRREKPNLDNSDLKYLLQGR